MKPEESTGINGNMYHVKDVNVNFSALLNSGCAFSSVSGVLIQTWIICKVVRWKYLAGFLRCKLFQCSCLIDFFISRAENRQRRQEAGPQRTPGSEDVNKGFNHLLLFLIDFFQVESDVAVSLLLAVHIFEVGESFNLSKAERFELYTNARS